MSAPTGFPKFPELPGEMQVQVFEHYKEGLPRIRHEFQYHTFTRAVEYRSIRTFEPKECACASHVAGNDDTSLTGNASGNANPTDTAATDETAAVVTGLQKVHLDDEYPRDDTCATGIKTEGTNSNSEDFSVNGPVTGGKIHIAQNTEHDASIDNPGQGGQIHPSKLREEVVDNDSRGMGSKIITLKLHGHVQDGNSVSAHNLNDTEASNDVKTAASDDAARAPCDIHTCNHDKQLQPRNMAMKHDPDVIGPTSPDSGDQQAKFRIIPAHGGLPLCSLGCSVEDLDYETGPPMAQPFVYGSFDRDVFSFASIRFLPPFMVDPLGMLEFNNIMPFRHNQWCAQIQNLAVHDFDLDAGMVVEAKDLTAEIPSLQKLVKFTSLKRLLLGIYWTGPEPAAPEYGDFLYGRNYSSLEGIDQQIVDKDWLCRKLDLIVLRRTIRLKEMICHMFLAHGNDVDVRVVVDTYKKPVAHDY